MKKSIMKRMASLLMASAVAVSALSVTSAMAYNVQIDPSATTDKTATESANRYEAYQIFNGNINTDYTLADFKAVAENSSSLSAEAKSTIQYYLDLESGNVEKAYNSYKRELKNITWGSAITGDKVSTLLLKLAKGTFTDVDYKDAFIEIYEEYQAVIDDATKSDAEKSSATNKSAIRVAEVLAGTYKVNGVAVGGWTTEDLQKFAAYVKNVIAMNPKSAPSGVSAYTNNTNASEGWVIENLNKGYYLVIDTETSASVDEGDSVSPYFLDVVQDTTVTVKSNSPRVTKEITNVNDANAKLAESKDLATAAIGDVIQYKLEGTVPTDLSDFYSYYFYQFTDTMSKGLTLDEDSVKVQITVGETTTYDIYSGEDGILDGAAGILTYGKDFFESYKPVGDDGDTVLKVTFWDLLKFFNAKYTTAQLSNFDWDSVRIVVTYSATLNENAVVGSAGNPNKVDVTYTNTPGSKNPTPDPTEPTNPSDPTAPTDPYEPDDPHDPNDPSDPDFTDPSETPDPSAPTNPTNPTDPDEPGEDPPGKTGKTPEDKATVFTYELDMKKVNGNTQEPLVGAGFTVTNADKTKTALFVTDDAGNATFVGWATQDELDAIKAAGSLADFLAEVAVDETNAAEEELEEADAELAEENGAATEAEIAAFKKQLKSVLTKTFGTTDVNLVTEIFTVAEGKLNIKGLVDGTYNFVETTTPVGFGTVDPFTVTLVVALETNGTESTADDYYYLTNESEITYPGNSSPDYNAELTSTADETTLASMKSSGIANLLVMDPPATILPGTGGAGRYFYYACGAFLALAGIAVLRRNKRKVTPIA